MSVLNEYNLLCLCRSDNSIELWTTNSWIQLLKIPGNDNIQTRKIKIIYKNKNNIINNNNNNNNNIIKKDIKDKNIELNDSDNKITTKNFNNKKKDEEIINEKLIYII
jgi:hypothetical protein